jgi:beta-N-acetylhexosaminidase
MSRISKYTTNKVLHLLSITAASLLFPALSLAQTKTLNYYVDKKIQTLTLDQKIGQLFIVGFTGQELSPELTQFIRRYKPGSFILFKRNISSIPQITKLNNDLYRLSFSATNLPPLLAVDQEGGSVSRLPIYPPPPNALAMGQTQSPLLVEEMGYQTALFLREVGFNMNLAPVLDVVDLFSAGFIGVRSFGSEAHLVSEMGTAYSKGLLRAKVLPTAKHFPGTGSVAADPHKTIVTSSASEDVLYSRDIFPFEKYTRINQPTAVMLSHLVYPAIDSSGEPASFSSHIIDGILRKKMNYQGLVVTDDLQMQGSRLLLKPEEAALKSLKSGSDVIMLTWSFADQEKTFSRVKKAVLSGEMSEEKLNEKLRRILVAKAMTHSYRKDSSDKTVVHDHKLSSTQYFNLEEKVLQSNLRGSLLPTALPGRSQKNTRMVASESHGKLCLLSPSKIFLDSFAQGYKQEFSRNLLSPTEDVRVINQWLSANACDTIVFTVTGKQSAKTVAKLSPEAKRKTLVVNTGAPRLVRSEKGYFKVIQLYFSHQEAGKKIAQLLEEILKNPSASYAIK